MAPRRFSALGSSSNFRLGTLAAGLWLAAGSALFAPPLFAQADTSPEVPADTARAEPPEIASLTLSQVHLRLPFITAYLRLEDADGRFLSELGDAELSATVAGEPVAVTGSQPFASTGEGVAYLLLVDVSRSVGREAYRDVLDGLESWLTSLGPEDRVAIVTFGHSVEVVADFTADTAALARHLEVLEPVEHRTLFYDGMLQALDLVARQDAALPARRVLVVVSDGQDSVTGGVSEQEVTERIQAVHVPIFGVGLYERPQTARKVEGLQIMGRFARTSGGEFLRADTIPPATAFETLTSYAHGVLVAELACEGCPDDGRIHRLQLTAETDTRTLSDGAYVRLAPVSVAHLEGDRVAAPWWRGWGTAAAGLPLVLVIAALVVAARRRRHGEVELADADDAGDAGGDAAMGAPAPVDAVPARGAEEPEPVPPLYVRLTPLGIAAPVDGRSVELLDQLRIGRDPAHSDVAFPDDPEISSIHCLLVRRDPHLLLRDLESTNGTSVNGVPIRGEQRVEDNDVIAIGRSELRLSIHGADDEHRA